MWIIFFEIPGGLILFGLVVLMAFTDGAGRWVIENMALITLVVYAAEIIQGILRCKRGKKQHVPLWVSVPFTALSVWMSTDYLLLIVGELAGIASSGIMGLLGLVVAAPLAILSCVICKGPGVVVNLLTRDGEGDTTLMVLDGVITPLLCLLCKWFFGYI